MTLGAVSSQTPAKGNHSLWFLLRCRASKEETCNIISAARSATCRMVQGKIISSGGVLGDGIPKQGFLKGQHPSSVALQSYSMFSKPERLFTISSSTSMQMNISADRAYIVGSTPRRAAEYTTIARFWSVLEVK